MLSSFAWSVESSLLSNKENDKLSLGIALVNKNCSQEMKKKKIEHQLADSFLRYECSRGVQIQVGLDGLNLVEINHSDSSTKKKTLLMDSKHPEFINKLASATNKRYELVSEEYRKEKEKKDAKKTAAQAARKKEVEKTEALIKSLLE